MADGFVARNQQRLSLDESEEMRDDRAYLDRLVAELAAEGFKVDAMLECGEPADRILALAEDQHCDLIAMSTHGHGFFSDLVLGSVADKVPPPDQHSGALDPRRELTPRPRDSRPRDSHLRDPIPTIGRARAR